MWFVSECGHGLLRFSALSRTRRQYLNIFIGIFCCYSRPDVILDGKRAPLEGGLRRSCATASLKTQRYLRQIVLALNN